MLKEQKKRDRSSEWETSKKGYIECVRSCVEIIKKQWVTIYTSTAGDY